MDAYDFASMLKEANRTRAFDITSGSDLVIFHGFCLIIGILNMTLIILLSWSFCWRRSYHPNFRILFLNFFFGLFCEAFFSAFYSLSVFVLNILDHPVLLLNSVGLVYGTNTLRISYFLFIIERTVATIKHASYEKNHQISLGIVLVIISHIIVAFLDLNYFYLGFNMFAQLGVLFLFDLITIISLIFLVYTNRRLRRINGRSTIALSQRYQVFENLRALVIALPIIVFGITFNIFGIITTVLQSMYMPLQQLRTPLFYVVMSLYNTMVLLLIIRKDKIARSRIINILKCGKNGIRYDSQSNTTALNQPGFVKNVLGENLIISESPERHFEALKTMWK